MTGVVESDERNSAAELSAFFRGAGNALLDEHTLPTCDISGTDCYNLKVMPTVSEVSSQ